MFNLNTLTAERKLNAIQTLIAMDSKKVAQVNINLKNNIEALQIVIEGKDTSAIKSEIANLSIDKAKEVFKFINDILLGVSQHEQELNWNELGKLFPESGIK
jgi:hypothetical protein